MLTYADQATTPNATLIYIFYCNPCTSCIAGVQVRRHALPSPAPGGCVVEWCQSLREMYIGCKCTVVTVVHFLLPRSGSLAKARHGWWKPQNWPLVPCEASQILNASDASDVTFQSEPRVFSHTFVIRLDRHCIGSWNSGWQRLGP